MATIARGTKASGGTAFLDGTTAYGSEVETDFNTVYTAWNNTDAGTTKWTVVNAAGATTVPLTADNLTGTQDVVDFKVNGTTKVKVDNTGLLTASNGVTVSGAALTMSGQTIVMGSNKITGLANGTASTDAAAFGQVKLLQTVVTTSTTETNTTSSAFQACTGMSVTITPTSASNRVKVTVSGSIETDDGNSTVCIMTLKRGSTDLQSGTGGFTGIEDFAVNGKGGVPCAFVYIDSPATTSAITYQIFIRSSDNAHTVRWNHQGVTASIIAEEIV